jgi:hypothetical protein
MVVRRGLKTRVDRTRLTGWLAVFGALDENLVGRLANFRS